MLNMNIWMEGYIWVHTGNVGYLQTASNGPLTFGGNTGNRAVDGNHDPDVSQSSCSHAMDDGTFGMVGEAWWTATLDADYVITGVIVTPSTGATRGMADPESTFQVVYLIINRIRTKHLRAHCYGSDWYVWKHASTGPELTQWLPTPACF